MKYIIYFILVWHCSSNFIPDMALKSLIFVDKIIPYRERDKYLLSCYFVHMLGVILNMGHI